MCRLDLFQWNPPQPAARRVPRPRRCGMCRGIGHDRRTCPQNAEQRAAAAAEHRARVRAATEYRAALIAAAAVAAEHGGWTLAEHGGWIRNFGQ